MKRKASASHDEAVVRRIRNDPEFAGEYLKAALEDGDEPRVLLLALRHIAQARGIAKIAKAAGIERELVPSTVGARKSPLIDSIRRSQSGRLAAHGGSGLTGRIIGLAGVARCKT